MSVLTHSQQRRRVGLLGFTFMIMFTAYNSLQNIVSKIYTEYGYDSLGQTSIILLYFMFAVGTIFSPFVIRKHGFKKVMFCSSLGYAVFEGAGLVVALWEEMPKSLGWTFVLFGAALCGISASMIWVASAAYISEVAGQERKTEMFGLFWSLMTSSQIIGNLITTFVLGLLSNTVYFLVLTILGFSSAFLFMFLPHVQSNSDSTEMVFKKQVTKVSQLIKDPNNIKINFYYFFPGLCVGFYATFLYKLIGLSLPQDDQQADQDYKKKVSFYSGLVFISLGVSQALTGLFMSKFAEKYDKFKLAVTGTLFVEVAGFVSLLCFFLKSYELCFAVAFLWGSSQTFIQTNTGALIGKLFPGKVQAYSSFRIIFALGVVCTIILNIALKSQPAWVFLTIVMGVQVITNKVSTSLSEMRGAAVNESVSLDGDHQTIINK